MRFPMPIHNVIIVEETDEDGVCRHYLKGSLDFYGAPVEIDVTEAMLGLVAQTRTETLKLVAMTLAHYVNGDLTAVSGNLDLIKRDPSNIAEHLPQAIEGAQNIGDFVTNFWKKAVEGTLTVGDIYGMPAIVFPTEETKPKADVKEEGTPQNDPGKEPNWVYPNGVVFPAEMGTFS